MNEPIIIGLGHVARTGKDALADYLVERYGFEKLGYTDFINAILYDSDPAVRNVIDRIGWEAAKNDYGTRVRNRQQDLGRALRKHLGPQVMVEVMERRWKLGGRYVVKNVRMPEEAASIKRRPRGFVYRVDRPGFGPVNQDITETALLGWDGWDGIILNDATLAELYQHGDEIMRSLGIYPA